MIVVGDILQTCPIDTSSVDKFNEFEDEMQISVIMKMDQHRLEHSAVVLDESRRNPPSHWTPFVDVYLKMTGVEVKSIVDIRSRPLFRTIRLPNPWRELLHHYFSFDAVQ